MNLRRGRADDASVLAELTGVEGEPAPPSASWWVDQVGSGATESPVVVAGAAATPTARAEGVVAMTTEPGGRGRITWLVVAPEHRRRGHARRLLISAERQLLAAGCTEAVLDLGPAEFGDGNGGPPSPTIERFLTAMGWAPEEAGSGRWRRRLAEDGSGDGSEDERGDGAHVRANRSAWDTEADDWVEPGRRAWTPEQRRRPSWGCWGLPEAEVGMLTSVHGADVIELGCGTGYVSAWCLEAGASSVVGLDNSRRQLATARALQAEHGMRFPLVWANAERTPLTDASFDLAISEYGAAIWCDPHRWIPEAARLLRPGGRLVFLGNSVLSVLCVEEFETDGAAGPRLLRPQRGLHRVAWLDHPGVEFHIGHGDMIRLLRSSGFDVLDLRELYLDPEAFSPAAAFVDGEFGSRWPVEEVWVAERRAD